MYKRQNQENLDKLDERMELLREELNKEINVNKKAMNKKLEEENIMVNRQIREIDGKCNQTEKEVQEFKEVVNIKFMNIEEHSRRKVEEQRKETQEAVSYTHLIRFCEYRIRILKNVLGIRAFIKFGTTNIITVNIFITCIYSNK